MRIINTHREPVPPARVLTEAEILSLCCEVVPVDECSETGKVGVYDGADQDHRNFDEEDALAAARAAYPRARILSVKVEGIGPPPGTPCGKLYESWESRNNCCEGVPALAWDMDVTPDVLPHGGSIGIAWNGSDGRQVELSTSSNGTWFSGGRKTVVGHGSSIELFAGDTFCGNTAVTVADACSSATVIIRSDLGTWRDLGHVCALAGHQAEHSGANASNYTAMAMSGKYKTIESQGIYNSWGWGYASVICVDFVGGGCGTYYSCGPCPDGPEEAEIARMRACVPGLVPGDQYPCLEAGIPPGLAPAMRGIITQSGNKYEWVAAAGINVKPPCGIGFGDAPYVSKQYVRRGPSGVTSWEWQC